ncbi:MAG: hypothetical protein JJU00_03570 [Opitutales bacterium]|nr:hypothetical protein [Opitutales bacterium]
MNRPSRAGRRIAAVLGWAAVLLACVGAASARERTEPPLSAVRVVQVGPVGVVSADATALLHTTGILRVWLPLLAADGLSFVGYTERVRVVLPPEDDDAASGWGVEGGVAVLRVPWGPSLPEDVFWDALAAALTHAWLLDRGIEGGTVPRWIRTGLVEQLRVYLNPARGDFLADHAVVPGTEDAGFDGVFSGGAELAPESFRARAYWLMEIALAAAEDVDRYAAFLEEASRAADGGRGAYQRLSALGGGAERFELWLAVCLVEFGSRGRGPFLTAAESRERIDALARTAVLRRGVTKWAHPRGLAALADDPALSALAAERGRAVRALLGRVHPVYHNALLSLGVAYERFPVADSGELEALAEQFEEDRMQAEAVERTMVELLRGE